MDQGRCKFKSQDDEKRPVRPDLLQVKNANIFLKRSNSFAHHLLVFVQSSLRCWIVGLVPHICKRPLSLVRWGDVQMESILVHTCATEILV